MAPDAYKACLNSALRLLTRRDHACAELDKKLQERGFEQPQIGAVINECLRMGYLNDERFAHTLVQQLQRRGYGIHLIRHKLNAKNLPADIISLSIASHCSDDYQSVACRQALAKKMKHINSDQFTTDLRNRLQRFLIGRGFSRHIVHRAIEESFHR